MTTQNPANRPRALIAMSGGVDSSVAACLMQQAGYDCTGITMRLTHNETLGQSGYAVSGAGFYSRLPGTDH